MSVSRTSHICFLTVVLHLCCLVFWTLLIGRTLPLHPDADNIGHADCSAQLRFGPIDAVYTWVNGSDLRWQRERNYWHRHWLDSAHKKIQHRDLYKDDAATENRFRDNDELKYSLRSLEKYAPWVRRIHLVTDGQVPTWLDLNSDRIRVVKHSEIFENTSHLPVFSSSAIESNLDRIPGLSEFFLYFNDDVFLGGSIWPEDFITPSGVQDIFLSHPVPLGAGAYPEYSTQNGLRHPNNNISACGLDQGDCTCLNDGHGGAQCETLVGEAYISSVCEKEEELTSSLVSLVLQNGLSLRQNKSPANNLWHRKRSDLDGSLILRTNTTDAQKVKHKLGSKNWLKIVALLDTFSQCHVDQSLVADAIRSVMKAFNAKFSRSRHLRRVPSHMPHMMSKQVLREIKDHFPRHFRKNSEHRFRHPEDVQVSFAYFNYLVNRHLFPLSARELWDQHLDVNHDGRLDNNEIYKLARLAYGESPPQDFYESLRSCLYNNSETISHAVSPRILWADVKRCVDIPKLRSHVHKPKSYRLKLGADVSFLMLSDEYQTVMDQLQSIRAYQTKFIALNDDMKDPSAGVRLALAQLLQDLWPTPSRFELPSQENHAGYVHGSGVPVAKHLIFSYICCAGVLLFGNVFAFVIFRKSIVD